MQPVGINNDVTPDDHTVYVEDTMERGCHSLIAKLRERGNDTFYRAIQPEHERVEGIFNCLCLKQKKHMTWTMIHDD